MHFLLNPSGLARLGEDYGWACALQWVPCGGASRWLVAPNGLLTAREVRVS